VPRPRASYPEGVRYAIRYGIFKPLLSLMGLGPRFSYARLDDKRLKVRMGWAFYASVPRSSIAGAQRSRSFVSGIGVHGWRGRWLVNGAAGGLVTITIEPVARAWVLGVPVKLRMLRVSLEDPDGLVAALR
jgi:hypothetical protein